MNDSSEKLKLVQLVPVDVFIVHRPKVSLVKNLFLEKKQNEDNEIYHGTPQICIPDSQNSDLIKYF
jgi:hypothetical protein